MGKTRKKIAIAGGGIAGMYCAIRLAQKGHKVVLLEASPDRWGGRMETGVMDGFIAEWGPMRFETKLQPKFGALIEELEIELDPFTGPVASTSPYPQYDLKLDEQNLDSLGLLRWGILRMLGKNPTNPLDPGCQAWIDSLTEEDYRIMRKEAKLNGKLLWQTGFWNALSEPGILSHQALMKIRDTGTFYHMIPDNLNAIEWAIWWLRALKTDGKELSTIKKGTSEITVQMLKRLEAEQNITLRNDAKLTAFSEAQGEVSYTYTSAGEEMHDKADHLFLAMPQLPLKELEPHFPDRIADMLDAVNGFPMLKIFIVLDKPWWNHDQPPQARANRMPTREVHYFRRPKFNDPDGHGMVLIYTDRPATEFWKYYVKNRKHHDRAEIEQNDEIKHQFANFLSQDVYRSLHSNEAYAGNGLQLTQEALLELSNKSLDEIKAYIEDSIVTYGIRDWGEAPYGAGNHSWRPGVKSWEIQDELKAFALDGSTNKNIHVVGEAYSDYTGFIEGAINSCDLALADF